MRSAFAVTLSLMLLGCTPGVSERPPAAPEPAPPLVTASWSAAPGVFLHTTDGARDVAMADVNRDGLLDVVIPGGASLQVLLNLGGRRFETATYPIAGEPFGIAVADLDADGWPEIAVAHDFENSVAVFAGDPRGPRPLGKWPTGSGPLSVTMRDADGDTRLDLVVGNGSDRVVTTLRTLADGGFAPTTLDGFSQPASPVVADFDGDGVVDLAGQAFGGLAFRRGDGQGGFAAAERLALRKGLGAMASLDLDHDGPLDLVAVSWGEGPMWLVFHDALGRHARELQVGVEPSDLEPADLDGDGNTDLVVADHRGQRVHVLFNDGRGTFVRRLELPTGDEASGVAVGDLDGDGALDVVSVDLNRAQVFYGERGGTRAATTCSPRGSGCEQGLSCCSGVECSGGRTACP